jgi:hypothetical protein
MLRAVVQHENSATRVLKVLRAFVQRQMVCSVSVNAFCVFAVILFPCPVLGVSLT